jgi:hypothetical protein
MFLTKCWKNIVQSLIFKNIKVVKVLNASSVPIILFSPSEVNRRKSGQITHFVSPPKYSFSRIREKFWQGIKIDIIIIILGLVSKYVDLHPANRLIKNWLTRQLKAGVTSKR